MKRSTFLVVLLFCPLLTIIGQERFVKDPNEIGACINVTSKLPLVNTGRIVNGGVTIWTLDEVVLVAKVTATGRKRERTGWAIIDRGGNAVTSSEATRTRTRAGKNLFQKVVYTRGTNPEGCFVVEQKEL